MPVVDLGEGEGEPRVLYPLGEKKKRNHGKKKSQQSKQPPPPLPHLAQGLDLPLHVTIKKRARHNGKSLAD